MQGVFDGLYKNQKMKISKLNKLLFSVYNVCVKESYEPF